MKVKDWAQLLLITGAFSLLIFSGPGCSREASETREPQTRIVKPSDPDVVEMDHPERFSLIEVEGRQVANEMHVNGVVAPDVNRSVAVLSLGGGRVTNITVKLGDDVRKGQLLLQINSPDLSGAFSDFQKAQSNESLARKQLERSKLLYDHGAIATKDLEVAEQAEESATVDLKTARYHIRVLGGNPEHVTPILDIRAPISGTIIEQNVTGGTGVRSLDATPNLFTIADLSSVWVLCDLYEDAISQVRAGDTAEVTLNAYPDKSFKGRICNISRVLDPATRSAKVRIELANPGMVMRSGMFVTAVFHSQKRSERPVLPTSAIVRLHDKDWVFRYLGGNQFRRTGIQTDPTVDDNLQQVLSGIHVHDNVVANALQFSDAAEAKTPAGSDYKTEK